MFKDLLIYLVTFGGVGALAYGGYPLLRKLFGKAQGTFERRADKDAEQLEDMFLKVEKKKLVYLNIGAPIVLALGAYLVTQNLIFAILGAGLGMFLPSIWIMKLTRDRKNKFHAQLIDALMILSSSLKGGLSLIQSIEEVVNEMPAPAAYEFGNVLRQVKLGYSLEEALEELRERMGTEEIDLLTTAVTLTQQTGGDLPEVLANLVQTMREKNKVLQQIKTLSLQGRIQGVIMSILPIAFFFTVTSMNKDFFNIMLEAEIGRTLLMAAVILQIVGMFLIFKFSKVRV